MYLSIIPYMNILLKILKTKSIGGKKSQYQTLSEDFIRKFKNKVDWEKISQYQELSEDFIREFKNKVHWVPITIKRVPISLDTCIYQKCIFKVIFYCIRWCLKTNPVQMDLSKFFKKYGNWGIIIRKRNITRGFC